MTNQSRTTASRAGADTQSAIPLLNEIRPYAWGSSTFIPEFLGLEPTGEPQAELWMGAHPGAPSRLSCDHPHSGRLPTLLSHIESDPVGELGKAVVAELGTRLPFLLKVLAAEQPLSLQAHPSEEQARTGYAEEDASAIPIDASHRNYRDTSHKPELLCALTPFEALCGFRSTPTTVRLLDGLGVAALAPYVRSLCARPGPDGLREVVTGLLSAPPAARRKLVTAVVQACGQAADADPQGEFAAEYTWGARIGARYPEDVGVVTALLMNLVHLLPGDAVFLPAGQLHAYLSGAGVEIMANSDNVLRGGLTPKHVDVPELLRILDFSDGPESRPQVEALPSGEQIYQAPVKEFRLSRLPLYPGRRVTLDTTGPQILLVADGQIEVTGESGRLSLPRGASAYVAAGRPAVTVTGHGMLFRATTNVQD